MDGCFGLLRSAQSDSVRVRLEVRDDVLVATDAGGISWDIPLSRVHLTSWASDEVHLELAGTGVSFSPEDPALAVSVLAPLLAGRQRPAPAPAGMGPVRAAPPPRKTRPLTVDLTDAARRRPAAPVPPPSPMVAPRVRRGYGRLARFIVPAIVVAAVVIFTQVRSTPDATDAAREAVAASGLPAVGVTVEGGRATLTGTVLTGEIADAVAGVVAGVDGIETVTNNLEVAAPGATIPEGAPPTSATGAAGAALAATGLEAVALRIDDAGTALLSGTVASEFDRRRAATVLAGIPGITQIDNQLVVASRADEDVQAAAQGALDAGGYESVEVAVEDGIVTVTGVVPREALDTGFFRYADGVDAAVLPIDGVAGLRNRLQLAGDEATLRGQLRDLTTRSPVVFALGRAELSAGAAATLDVATQIIQGQPGLRVLIAGHTDTTGSAGFNEELSRGRAEAVRSYLIDQGVAANRLLVVAYGELFPSTPGAQPGDRRVEFEVAG